MADINYTVGVDASAGVNSLKQLQAQVTRTQEAFSKFQSVIGSLAIGAFVSSAYRMAGALDDVSVASGIALKNVIGFGQAVAANGGSIDSAATGISRLSQFISSAAEGNRQAQESFAQLGIGLEDLRTLSETDILRRTIEGLARTDDASRRTAIGVDIFGKTFAKVDVKSVNDQLDAFTQKAAGSSDAVASAAQVGDNFARAFGQFQLELLKALKPLSELAVSITENTDGLGKFIKTAVEIGLVIASFTLVGKAVAGVRLAFAGLQGAAAAIRTGFGGLSKTFEFLGYTIGNIFKAFSESPARIASAVTMLGKNFGFLTQNLADIVKGFFFIGPAILAAKIAIENFFDVNIKDRAAAFVQDVQKMIPGFEKLQEMMGNAFPKGVDSFKDILPGFRALESGIDSLLGRTRNYNQAAVEGVTQQTQAYGALGEEFEALSEDQQARTAAVIAASRAVADANAKEAASVQTMVSDYQQLTGAYMQKFQMGTQQLRMTEEQRVAEETLAEAQQNYLKAIEPLVKRVAELRASSAAKDKELLPVVEAALARITTEYEKSIPVLQKLIAERINEMQAQKQQLALEEQLRESTAKRERIQESITDYIQKGQELARNTQEDIQIERLQGVNRELKLAEVNEKRLADAAKARIAEMMGDDPSGLEAANAAIDRVTQNNIKNRQQLVLVRDEEARKAKDLVELEKQLEEGTKRRLAAEEAVRDIVVDGQDKIKRAQDELELSGMTGVQKQLRMIAIEEERVAAAAKRRVAEQFGDNDPAGLARAMSDIDKASAMITQKRSAQAEAIYQQQRQFSTGWSRAWADYADKASDASAEAERLFTKSTQGMEDAIVGFAKTGKFEWKDFVAVVLEELLRSNLRKVIAEVFAPTAAPGGMGGLFGGGQQAGGQQVQQQPGGGGLFGMLGNLFGGSTGSTQPTGEDFGGFFANGGTIPAGKYGMVGERGPELISGPAQVTPMTGTQVVYNINAVDARSFQELLATDPRTIFALSEQGRKSLPGQRR